MGKTVAKFTLYSKQNYHTDGEKVITVDAFSPFFRAYKSPLFGIDTM